jgi:hypothetical protein
MVDNIFFSRISDGEIMRGRILCLLSYSVQEHVAPIIPNLGLSKVTAVNQPWRRPVQPPPSPLPRLLYFLTASVTPLQLENVLIF